VALPQCGFDNFLFLPGQDTIQRTRSLAGIRDFPPKPGFVDRKSSVLAQDDGSLNHVLQFTNVPRPVIRLQQCDALFVDRSEFLSSFLGEAVDEILN